ncbi:Glycosyltransferase-like protein [Vibrio chagasii]|uniref:glycosyltransferase family 4 protein n=1 Tax=Vibrio chagasii TaxID=170679 RepID=UPI0033844170|nr:Glycosyltransferase-like protein [Vibrio chagasii]CAH7101659.1 Glycosyltransferase-like protein [Vibrio chagasii]CAH7117345.1 Glycosyltransferase-like protein [Vibrio chagasii]CAH7329590.1 Glycosyltransferase-like protein [Vibrio chagasii]
MKFLSITNMYPNESNQKGIFVKEINDGLEELGIHVDVFNVDTCGRSILKYMNSIPEIAKIISNVAPNVIHVHFGLTFISLLPLLPLIWFKQAKVVVFFHGSDVLGDSKLVRCVSFLAAILSNSSIAVSKEIKSKLPRKINKKVKEIVVLPCGIENDFFEIENNQSKFDIIFPSSPSRKEKNYKFFLDTFNEIKKVYPEANIVLFDSLDREQVKKYLGCSKLMLLTSDREGSPQVFKEAMAAGLPVLSRNVGDVLETSKLSPNAYVAKDSEFTEIALKILSSPKVIEFDKSDLYDKLSVKSICEKIRDISYEC